MNQLWTRIASTSLTFNLSDYGFVENDRLVIGIYSYCLRHDGVKMFNGGGTGVAQVFSDTLEVHPERFCRCQKVVQTLLNVRYTCH